MSFSLALVAASFTFSAMSIGGGLYEFLVVDPAWPHRLDLIQPQRGGISRKRFWIPAHSLFEASLILALILWWSVPAVWPWLAIAFISQLAMRVWSILDFIPRALAFETSEPSLSLQKDALRWTRRSRLRLPLDLVTTGAMLLALVAVIRY